ncbi:MAG: hypothetical protein K2I96_03040 [Lachnospiraceae bacterium]|nr:hypothetical protein [Lachnospiraceae bacterium]
MVKSMYLFYRIIFRMNACRGISFPMDWYMDTASANKMILFQFGCSIDAHNKV